MEATGLNPRRNAMVSLGAVDFAHPENQFYSECRIWEGSEIDPQGIAVGGFTEEQVTDPNKQSLEEMMRAFYAWIEPIPEKVMAGQNAYLDREYVNDGFKRAGIDFEFNKRIVELHSVAYVDHLRRGVPMPLKADGFTNLSLDNIAKYVGLPEEPRPHNGLTGAKYEAEIFARMLYGTNILPDFENDSIPDIFKI